MNDNVIRFIEVITKLILASSLIILPIVFKKPIESLLFKGSIKLKRNGTEIEVNSGNIEQVVPAVAEDQVANVIVKDIDENIPKTENDENAYLKYLLDAYIERDQESLVKAIEAIENSNLDGNEKLTYKIIYYRFSYELGNTEYLSKIEELAEKNKTIQEVYIVILKNLAYCYKYANLYEKAMETYEIAKNNSNNIIEKAEFTTSIAFCALKLKQNETAINIVLTAIKTETNKDALFIYYKELANIYENLKENELKSFALELALLYNPNNIEITFDMAYTYANESNFKDLTLFHYKNLLKSNPKHGNGLNNIGIAYSELGLYGLKIDSYKKSMETGNTLANANLSYEYISKGFYSEAKEILKEASLKDNVHANVTTAIAKLNENMKTEEEKEKEFLDKAIVKQNFIRKYAEAYFTTTETINISNISWEHNESSLEIDQTTNIIKGNWSENSIEFMFEGKINNKAIKAKVSKMQLNPYTQTQNYVKYADAYIYISKDNDTLSMLIIEDDKLAFNIKDFIKFAQRETA